MTTIEYAESGLFNCQILMITIVASNLAFLFPSYTHINLTFYAPTLSALSLSYISTEPINTCAPFAQSSGAQYSAGLCDTPSLQGTKIIEVGTRLLVKTLSWPVREEGEEVVSTVGFHA